MSNVPKIRFKEFNGEWESKKLKELCSDFIVPMRDKPQVFDGNIPWCRIEDIEGKYLNGTKSNQYVSKEIVENMNLKVNPTGTLICSCSAAIGNNAITTIPLITNQTFIGLVCEKIDNEYLYYLMGTKKRNLEKIAGGTTIPYISRKKFEEFIVLVPSLQEQEKIASFLSLIDDKINLQSEKVKCLKDYKKGLMQKIFSRKLRFKDENGNDYPEWEEKKLGEICDITTGKLDANCMIENGKYRFYTCAKEYFRINDFAFDTEALLISGNGANVGYIHYYKGKFNAYQRTYILDKFNDNIKYIKYYLEKSLKQRILKEKNEGNTPYIVLSTLKNMNINLPCLKEQNKIANILSSVDKKIEKEQEKLDSLKEYKKGLLQQMFV